MTSPAAQLAAYNRNAILSATPAQLLVMLYDRLVLDLKRAEAAQLEQNWADARTQLLHAQDIIDELVGSLNVKVWDGGENLLAIYQYVRSTLVSANVNRDVKGTQEALARVEPLAAAWREATQSVEIRPVAVGGELGVG
jgi:flagellar protein FliS